LADHDQTRIDMKRAVAQLFERPSPRGSGRRSVKTRADDWLGGESHVPNLGRELRERNEQAWDHAWAWVAGGLFMAGVALGSLVTLLLTRSRQAR
jgi:hypothetical protein